jgi:hypothetical protein
MPHGLDDPEFLADAIEHALKTALAPVVKRLRELETKWGESWNDPQALRARLAVLETRTAPSA